MTEPDYIRIIKEEYEQRTGILYLGDCEISSFPQEIYGMNWLKELVLSAVRCLLQGQKKDNGR